MKASRVRFTKRLSRTFHSCVSGNKDKLLFSADSFFSKWFRKLGTPYYFLFQKNLSTTNIQFAELVSLIRLHTRVKGTQQHEASLHFIIVRDFIRGMQEVVDDLATSKPTQRALCDTFLNLYADVLWHMVLLDVFHGSCAVFFPPHMKLDLAKVCSESGYIHSTGHSVFARELSIADAEDFKKAITSYLKKTFRGKRVFFVVYSHEDFTRYDRDHASYLRGGLDDVKIYVEKYYLGKKPLIRALREVQSENKQRMFLADAGDYKNHAAQIKQERLATNRTMWLIIDRAQPGDERFLVCYDQRYKNANPLHLFDENKPAWIAHTTIPHTLAGAMTNVTRTLWPKRSISIYDPFCGTGTTAFEALKFGSVNIVCSDKSPLARLLLEDNLAFFAARKERLKGIHDYLKRLSDPGCAEYAHEPRSHKKISSYRSAIALIDEVHAFSTFQSTDQWFDIPREVVRKLTRLTLEERLPFYLALRTELRHVSAFERGSVPWVKAYCEEIKTLLFQVECFCELKDKRRITSHGRSELLSGTYSQSCTINPKTFDVEVDGSESLTLVIKDARIHPRKKFDVIITDPPYGLNNEVSTIELADLLTKTLDVLFTSLKPNAQMVIALPDRSHSGRRIPLFATRMWVTEQIISKAEEHGFEAVVPANILPRFGNLFQPPYFWNSEKALKRVILHFQFRLKKRPHKGIAAVSQ